MARRPCFRKRTHSSGVDMASVGWEEGELACSLFGRELFGRGDLRAISRELSQQVPEVFKKQNAAIKLENQHLEFPGYGEKPRFDEAF